MSLGNSSVGREWIVRKQVVVASTSHVGVLSSLTGPVRAPFVRITPGPASAEWTDARG